MKMCGILSAKSLVFPWLFFWSPNFERVRLENKNNGRPLPQKMPERPPCKSIHQVEAEIRVAVDELFGNLLEDYPYYCYVEAEVSAPKRLKFKARGRKVTIFVYRNSGVTPGMLVFTRERAVPGFLEQACAYPKRVTGIVVYRIP